MYAFFPVMLLTCVTFFLLLSTEPETTGNSSQHKQYHRVISLSPSLTRMIIDIDADSRLVGVTSYHPPLRKEVPVVGTLVNLNMEKIITQKPDLVILSGEDNPTQFTERLRSLSLHLKKFSGYTTFDTIAETYTTIGAITGKQELARKKLDQYRTIRKKILARPEAPVDVLFLLSDRPLIAANHTSFIGNIINDAGGHNIITTTRHQYPVITAELIIHKNPRVIITTSSSTGQRLKELLGEDAMRLSAVKNKAIHYISYDPACYYTPGDYIKTLAEFRKIFNKDI